MNWLVKLGLISIFLTGCTASQNTFNAINNCVNIDTLDKTIQKDFFSSEDRQSWRGATAKLKEVATRDNVDFLNISIQSNDLWNPKNTINNIEQDKYYKKKDCKGEIWNIETQTKRKISENLRKHGSYISSKYKNR